MLSIEYIQKQYKLGKNTGLYNDSASDDLHGFATETENPE